PPAVAAAPARRTLLPSRRVRRARDGRPRARVHARRGGAARSQLLPRQAPGGSCRLWWNGKRYDERSRVAPRLGPPTEGAGPAAWTRVVLSQGFPARGLVERRLPALSSCRGERPAQERRCPGVGKRLISTPSSATRTEAASGPIPRMVVRRSTAARKGVRASPRRASRSRTAACRASIWVR